MGQPLDPSGRAVHTPPVEIDARLIAGQLELDLATFRRLMDQGRIAVLCERGVGEDAGRYRASFYHAGRRARLVVDETGRPVPGPPCGS